MAQNQIKVNKERIKDNRIFTCDNRGNIKPVNGTDPGMFLPVAVGVLNSAKNYIEYTEGTCFKNISFSYSQSGTGLDGDIGDVTVTIDTENNESFFCSDWFFFATTAI